MLLVIDSATEACSVALLDGDAVVAERHEIVGRGHAERLIPMIAEVIGGSRPEAILVDCGPGSFTGIRVGLAAAHGLAIGWGIPVQGYSSLALIAAGQAFPELTVALNGGHGQLFVQTYVREPLRALGPLQSLLPEAAATHAPDGPVAGSGAALLIATRCSGEPIEAYPRASDAKLLPLDLRILPPRPLYGRGPDARPMA
ncbi:tRNA (adenosine(37)-N6)-threonylcarbamoyltransferase complex dimerization subunit type 1 TsaB [Allosphingosinicella flava]|uniref:tRNA (Adenosine(37)-N6)-threonylcarbamoyltransferase complex dimerization subunit type 1 TsaB n=1 Tax=Allosphingosinicella flava TaxID=2771430 RepID=A0A7T2GHW5_9SPHN|nr:tRNA (adenosine(37)-N6)-threonylcarbamoyltransferase complex dimerization subunit type 1 TsaB [Sphingosinicella flava]QPQ54180.1 tRNA (adenosine(37)-N6)-threonylcarbamoyltransferase complex dimerization subunit type 1 TsaB [Sphingosinicella flava]